METIFHVFTDGQDFNFEDEQKAINKFYELEKQGCINIRMYKVDGYESEETEQEECDKERINFITFVPSKNGNNEDFYQVCYTDDEDNYQIKDVLC